MRYGNILPTAEAVSMRCYMFKTTSSLHVVVRPCLRFLRQIATLELLPAPIKPGTLGPFLSRYQKLLPPILELWIRVSGTISSGETVLLLTLPELSDLSTIQFHNDVVVRPVVFASCLPIHLSGCHQNQNAVSTPARLQTAPGLSEAPEVQKFRKVRSFRGSRKVRRSLSFRNTTETFLWAPGTLQKHSRNTFEPFAESCPLRPMPYLPTTCRQTSASDDIVTIACCCCQTVS